MKKLFAAALLLNAGFSMSAHAGLISGTHVTNGGKTVNLQGLEWMPLTYTAGMSRNQVEDAGGFTDRFGGVWTAGSWRYATRSETALLLQSLWGGTETGWSASNFDGVNWFDNNFGLTGSATGYGPFGPYSGPGTYVYGDFYYGSVTDSGCSPNFLVTCLGHLALEFFPLDNLEDRGWFSNAWGLSANYSGGYTSGIYNFSPSYTGSLLVRDINAQANAVNNPSAISLLVLGLGALLLRRRKTAA